VTLCEIGEKISVANRARPLRGFRNRQQSLCRKVRQLHNSVELRQLVEKQDASMGERNLSWTRARPTAHEEPAAMPNGWELLGGAKAYPVRLIMPIKARENSRAVFLA
jgi:hypothetical protein